MTKWTTINTHPHKQPRAIEVAIVVIGVGLAYIVAGSVILQCAFGR